MRDNLGDSHRVPAIARSKMTTPGSGCRHRHARDGLRFHRIDAAVTTSAAIILNDSLAGIGLRRVLSQYAVANLHVQDGKLCS